MKTFREYSKGNFYVVIQNKNEDLSKERYFYLRTGKSIEEIVCKIGLGRRMVLCGYPLCKGMIRGKC